MNIINTIMTNIENEFYNANEETRATFDFDFKAISQLDFKVSPSQLNSFSKKVAIRFYNDEWQQHHIKQVMGVYSMTPSGLGRAIQRSNLKKIWRQFDQQVGTIEKNVHK